MIFISSTNRSDARDFHVSDYYRTPIPKIKEFLNEFSKYENILNLKIRILDPCAGGDNTNSMSYPTAIQDFLNQDILIDTIDIRDDSRANLKQDYLEFRPKEKYDVIITNPPFNLSLDIINKALNDVKEDGFVIMLLRLNYLGGKVRQELWRNNMPKYIFVHNKRMSFTDDGKTDSIEYAHFVWQKGYNPNFSRLKVLMSQ
ncbi:hypothetical protein IR152_10655 [Clostridioides sp. ES-S-0108-01]|uniref:class I SAM-dependent methyltransferase n=1 Tax=Clostridioides sp. ES-S-0108-01 TaxID=2770773 RepID=UPI001D0C5553|nr:hypothetical protein [Clostridioides sp. ES-S-0108-01]